MGHTQLPRARTPMAAATTHWPSLTCPDGDCLHPAKSRTNAPPATATAMMAHVTRSIFMADYRPGPGQFHAELDQAAPAQAEPAQAEPTHAASFQARPVQAAPFHWAPAHPPSFQARPVQTHPSQSAPFHAHPFHA